MPVEQIAPFETNTNDFYAGIEVSVKFVFAGLRIKKLPTPTHYGNEECRAIIMKYV